MVNEDEFNIVILIEIEYIQTPNSNNLVTCYNMIGIGKQGGSIMDIRAVYSLIEFRRNELNTLASIYGVEDERVLMKSEQLDHIINEYFRKKITECIQQINMMDK